LSVVVYVNPRSTVSVSVPAQLVVAVKVQTSAAPGTAGVAASPQSFTFAAFKLLATESRIAQMDSGALHEPVVERSRVG